MPVPAARLLRPLALAFALGVVVWMALLQSVVTPSTRAPWAIFTILALGWGAACALLVWRPRLGAVFTVVLGVASAFGTLQTHAGAGWENTALAGLAIAAAGAAGGHLVARRA